MVDKKTKQVICTFTGKGREHDFKRFKRSALTIHDGIALETDKGYQGIKLLHPNSQTPHRKPPKKELSKEQKAYNRKLASERITVKHVIGKLKVFRSLQERYRNRRRRLACVLLLLLVFITTNWPYHDWCKRSNGCGA
jgi:hypothetical protein